MGDSQYAQVGEEVIVLSFTGLLSLWVGVNHYHPRVLGVVGYYCPTISNGNSLSIDTSINNTHDGEKSGKYRGVTLYVNVTPPAPDSSVVEPAIAPFTHLD